MANLTTRYLGLTLANPIIVSSCTHTIKPDAVAKLEAAGAGAVVLKSIFEEQIRADTADMVDALEGDTHPEAMEYLRADLPMQLGPETYLDRIREIKEATTLPVIASVNCTTAKQWVSFARKIEAAGADAIELNVYDVADDPDESGADIEVRHLDLVRAVKAEVGLPIAVKLGPAYSSLAHFAHAVESTGVAGLVLFNRFLQPDIDTDTCEVKLHVNLSREEDILLPLRWIAILRGQLSCDLSLTTGVHSGLAAAKGLLAGANTVQVCSVLYNDGFEAVSRIVAELTAWMDEKGFASIDDFRGRAGRAPDGASRLERAQYVKALTSLE